MPEGDTLFRTAATLHRWLAGRPVTAATTTVVGLPADRMVGRRITWVEAKGKHLLIHLEEGLILHSHMRMTGSWHVYTAGEPWRRPHHEARLVLECGQRQAVCFNAPTIELLRDRDVAIHPSLRGLGPDILVQPLDLDEVRRRARAGPPDLALGELLLDQQVMAGIGNIWRCETLFVEGHHPWKPQSALTDDELDRLVLTANRLMSGHLGPTTNNSWHRWVYKRNGRPCRRCGTLIEARRQGELARTAYWCPQCQR